MKFFFKLLFLTAFLFQGCIVSKKKFDDLLAQKVRADGDLAEKTTQLDKANADLTDLNEKLKKLKADTTELGESYRISSQKLADLNKEYDQLNAYYKNLLNNSGKLNRDLVQNREQLLAIQENLE